MNPDMRNYEQNNRWIDPDSIASYQPEAQFQQVIAADANLQRMDGQMQRATGQSFFLPDAAEKYGAGKQDISAARNAGDRNKFVGFTKPDKDGNTTMWLSGQDRSPSAEFARVAQTKLSGYLPENFGTQPFAFKGKLENGMFIMEGAGGKPVSIPEAELRKATGKQLNKLLGKEVEQGQDAKSWKEERYPAANIAGTTATGTAPAPGLSAVGKAGSEGGLNPQTLLQQAPTTPMFIAPNMQPSMSTTVNPELPQFPQFAQNNKPNVYAEKDKKDMQGNPIEAALSLIMKQQAGLQAQLNSYKTNKGGMYAPTDVW